MYSSVIIPTANRCTCVLSHFRVEHLILKNPLRVLSQEIAKMSEHLPVNSSAERNKRPILEILKKYINPETQGTLLEISSGTGQHCEFFAPHFPKITFQPSEYDRSMIPIIKAYIKKSPTNNINEPLNIDVTTPNEKWGLTTRIYDYMLNINMIHISPFTCTENLFKNAGILLKPEGILFTYGPYARNGVLEPESNVNFDRMLKRQNSEWGVRDIVVLQELAEKNGLKLNIVHDMPSNNKCLIWEKM